MKRKVFKLLSFMLCLCMLGAFASGCNTPYEGLDESSKSTEQTKITTQAEITTRVEITTQEKPKMLTSQEAKAILKEYIEKNGESKDIYYYYYDDDNNLQSEGKALKKTVTFKNTIELGRFGTLVHELELTVGYTEEDILIYYFRHTNLRSGSDPTYSTIITSNDGEVYELHINSKYHKASTRAIDKYTNFVDLNYKVFSHQGCSGMSAECRDIASHVVEACLKNFDNHLKSIDPLLDVNALGFKY